MATPRLIGILESPWTEKARWALDHHGIRYRFHAYMPMVEEPILRIRTGRYRGKITVPVFKDGDLTLTESFEIARYADARGSGSKLIPDDRADAIAEWNRKSDLVMEATRVLEMPKMREDKAALREALPGFVPNFARPLMAPFAKMAINHIIKKYNVRGVSQESARELMVNELEALSRELSQRQSLLPEFSYADIAMACSLQLVSPVADQYIRIGPARRACWLEPELSARFSTLLEWRDALYAKYRKERASE